MRDSPGSAGGVSAAAAGSLGAAGAARLGRGRARGRSGLGPSLLGSFAKVFGDLGHGVTSRCTTDLQRTGDAAILANPPEVDGHEDDGDEREHQDVEHVPPQQRLGTDLDAT